jgi:ABC-2 type transport system permease protein
MRLLRAELTKLVFQKRTYVGWVGLLAVPIILTVALSLSAHPDQGGGAAAFLARASQNGMYVPLASIAVLAAFLLPLLASMSGAHQLAGEAEQGTIKTWLTHPLRRGSVLMSKWGAAVIYIAIGLALVAAGGYLAGGIAFGLHAPLLISTTGIASTSIAGGLWLTFLAYLYVLLFAMCVLALAMLISTFTDSSLTAAIGALVVVIVLTVLGSFSYFDFLKPYLFTSQADAWQNLFTRPLIWSPVVKGIITFGAYIVVFTSAAWLRFRRKDILV